MIKVKTLLFNILLLSLLCGIGLTQSLDYQAIDNYALRTPKSEAESLARLASYLTKTARNDHEKVRVIFRWLTDNIAYDVNSYFNGKQSDCSPNGVLRNRKSVCEGYASLFEALCLLSNLEVKKIRGYAKGYGYRPGEKFRSTNHSWNAIKIDGKWHLLDVTWGAGHVTGGKKFIKSFEPFYFLTPPDQFIFSHLPVDSAWQLLENPITLQEYENQAYLRPSFFKLGFSVQDIRDRMKAIDFKGFPESYDLSGEKILLYNAPVDKFLPLGHELNLRIKAPNALAAAIINGGEWYYLKKENEIFTGAITCKTGNLKISLKFPQKDNSFWTLLEYVVE